MPEAYQGLVDRAFFTRHPVHVAFDLLGMEVSVTRDGNRTSGRIVEAEAYAGPDDPASHAGKYRVGREAMFAEVGRLYMYRSYGIHSMANIVCHEAGHAGAVLIRALEPLDGLELMRERRGNVRDIALTRGPGTLCQALDLRLTDNGHDLLASPELRLRRGCAPEAIRAGERIGISKGLSIRWRFFDAESRHVSAHRRGDPVDRSSVDALIPEYGTIIV